MSIDSQPHQNGERASDQSTISWKSPESYCPSAQKFPVNIDTIPFVEQEIGDDEDDEGNACNGSGCIDNCIRVEDKATEPEVKTPPPTRPASTKSQRRLENVIVFILHFCHSFDLIF